MNEIMGGGFFVAAAGDAAGDAAGSIAGSDRYATQSRHIYLISIMITIWFYFPRRCVMVAPQTETGSGLRDEKEAGM